jgi:hypothetical protein
MSTEMRHKRLEANSQWEADKNIATTNNCHHRPCEAATRARHLDEQQTQWTLKMSAVQTRAISQNEARTAGRSSFSFLSTLTWI